MSPDSGCGCALRLIPVLDYANISRGLTGFPAKYTNARVISANFLGEPERRPGDPGDFAEYVDNLELQWVPLP